MKPILRAPVVQGQHTLLEGGSSGLSHHSGARIDKIRLTIHDDGRARSGALRIRQRRPRAQENNLGLGIALLCAGDVPGHARIQNSATCMKRLVRHFIVVGVFPHWRIYAEVAAASTAGAGRS
jgi:hypothetical protein